MGACGCGVVLQISCGGADTVIMLCYTGYLGGFDGQYLFPSIGSGTCSL